MIYTSDQVAQILGKRLITNKVAVLGYRSATSKYGEYDDTLALFSPDGYQEFKGNTLPSISPPGTAVLQPGDYTYKIGIHGISHFNLSKDTDGHFVNPADAALYNQLVATGKDLPPIAGRILPYWAFRQAGPVTVLRIGQTVYERFENPNNWPWIDIHHGGWNLTSSLGCQTLYPDHWQQFFWDTGKAEMDKWGQKTITYSLIDMAAA
jgi:hypothetical protein